MSTFILTLFAMQISHKTCLKQTHPKRSPLLIFSLHSNKPPKTAAIKKHHNTYLFWTIVCSVHLYNALCVHQQRRSDYKRNSWWRNCDGFVYNTYYLVAAILWFGRKISSCRKNKHRTQFFYEVLLLCLDCEFWKVGTERKRRSSAVFMAVDRSAGLKEGPFCS